jgi:hypothetical protein
MKNGLLLPLSYKELLDLFRVWIDRDEAAALARWAARRQVRRTQRAPDDSRRELLDAGAR